MTLVAVMRQPMRIKHLAAYVHLHASDGSAVVVGAHEASIRELELPNGTTRLFVASPFAAPPVERLVHGRLRGMVSSRAGSGSRIGQRLERFARSVLWRLRHIDQAVVIFRKHRPRHGDPDPDALAAALRVLAAELPVECIVVFDVFDLPATYGVADPLGIQVFVR